MQELGTHQETAVENDERRKKEHGTHVLWALLPHSNNRILFQVLPHLFQYRKGSNRTGGKNNLATSFEVCQFVYMIVCKCVQWV
jgi:hypothetical protein